MKKKYQKWCRLAVLCFALAVVMAAPSGREKVHAETKQLWTVLSQESGDMYENHLELGLPVATNVILNKNTIVIYGSIRETESQETDDVSKHTYKLAENVKYVSEGGTGAAQKMDKKEFKAYLEKVKDSGLGLILKLKNNKVVRISVSS